MERGRLVRFWRTFRPTPSEARNTVPSSSRRSIMNYVKTLFIDIGQVLVTLDYPAALRKVAEHTRLSPAEIDSRLRAHADIPRYECGRITSEEFYLSTCRLLEIQSADLSTFETAWHAIFASDPAPDACISPDLFSRLKSRFQVVALSNTNQMHFEYLYGASPIIREFDDYVLSYRVGAMKPQAEIYQAALAQTGRQPEETFFVDDLAVNIAAAAALGIRGVRFEGEEALQRDLCRLGLLPAEVQSGKSPC